MSRTATFTLRSPMPVPADELYAWHSRPLAFQRLQPPWEKIELRAIRGTFGSDGFQVEFQAHCLGPVKRTWVAEFSDFRPGREFRYRQVRGPFALWNHTHRMIPSGPSCYLENHVEYRLPLGVLGRALAGRLTRRRIAALFAYRHALTAGDLRRHARFADRPRLTVAVTGSRGLIGSALVPFLTTGGHRIVRLVTGRSQQPFDDGTGWVSWDPRAKPDPAIFDGIDAVIHLAGENVANGRWTAERKKRIVESRTGPTRAVADALAALPADQRPKVFVCASAIGYYGSRGDELLTEESPRGTGFFPEVCQAWEDATEPARMAGIRTVNLRFGVVLSPRGGALGKQLPAFKSGLGASLGSGRQWVPWIGINDVVGAIHHGLMLDAVNGPVNLVSPNPVTNRVFTKTLARVLCRPAILRLPRFLLRALFGELADAGLLASLRAVPGKLAESGFEFEHSNLENTLRFVLGRG